MSSQRRIDASQTNGAKSHGSTTPEGLLTSALNSLRHGMASKTVVLNNESVPSFERILNACINHFHPQTEVEMDLVEEMRNARKRGRGEMAAAPGVVHRNRLARS